MQSISERGTRIRRGTPRWCGEMRTQTLRSKRRRDGTVMCVDARTAQTPTEMSP